MKIRSQLFSSYYLEKSGFNSRQLKTLRVNESAYSGFKKAAVSLLEIDNPKFLKAACSRMNDIIQKFIICKDSMIRRQVVINLKELQKRNPSMNIQLFSGIEELLDCVNSASGIYCPTTTYYPKTETLLDVDEHLYNMSKKDSSIDKNLLYPVIRKVFLKNKDKYTPEEIEHLQKIGSLDSIKRYIGEHSAQDSISTYLWKKYFLNNKSLNPEFKDQLLDINSKFGVKIFIDDFKYLTQEILNYIKNEFEIWKSAGGDKVSFPKTIDITQFCDFQPGTVADSSRILKRIRLWLFGNIDSLRHEMIHQNEVVNKINFVPDTPKTIIPEHRKNEMLAAGLTEQEIDYAKEPGEYCAVWGSGKISAYSKDYKQEMVEKYNLPEFITRLESHGEYNLRFLKSVFQGEDNSRKLDLLNKFFNGEIPESTVLLLLENKAIINFLDTFFDKHHVQL